MAKAQCARYGLTSAAEKAHNKARLELAKGIPNHLKNKPFEIVNLDDDTENAGPKNSSQDRSLSEANLAGAFFLYDSFLSR